MVEDAHGLPHTSAERMASSVVIQVCVSHFFDRVGDIKRQTPFSGDDWAVVLVCARLMGWLKVLYRCAVPTVAIAVAPLLHLK